MGFIMTKQAYEAPKMESLGSFEKLTQSTSTGLTADASFDSANLPDLSGMVS